MTSIIRHHKCRIFDVIRSNMMFLHYSGIYNVNKKYLKGVMKEMEESMNRKEIQGLQKTMNKVLKQMEKEIQLGIWTLGPKIKCY